MIVIVADKDDQSAGALVRRWAPDCILMTPLDLSMPGWRQIQHRERCTAVANGIAIPQQDISGVLVRLPWVFEQHVMHIVAHDREYVAAEMAALLLYWLARLQCPILNRPTPTCLSGPYWRQEQWVHVAARLGIPVNPLRRSVPFNCLPLRRECRTVTIVGDYWFGDVDAHLARQARRLADVAGVELLAVQFDNSRQEARFAAADIFPDMSDAAVVEAVFEYLQTQKGRSVRKAAN